jgi:hypothetical protein
MGKGVSLKGAVSIAEGNRLGPEGDAFKEVADGRNGGSRQQRGLEKLAASE